MARPGISYADVADAATQLLEKGRNPTIEQIRLLLGTGSSTTIAYHLKEWKANQSGTKLAAAKENLPPELIGTLKQLWEGVIHQSEEKVSGIEVNFQESLSALEQELQKYKTNNKRWQRLFNQWLGEREQLLTEKKEQEDKLQKLNEENAMLHTHQDRHLVELHEKQQRINQLSELLKEAQTNVVNVCEISINERDKFAKTYQLLEKKYEELQLQLEKERMDRLEIEKAKMLYMQSSKQWEKLYEEAQKRLEEKIVHVLDLQNELKGKLLSQMSKDAKKIEA